MRAALFLTLVVLAGPGQAECPTREALKDGGTAYVSYPDGGTVGLRWMGAGVIEETTRYPDGVGEFRMISMGGIFIIDEVNLDGTEEIASSRITSRYPDGLYDRLPLKPGSAYSVTATNSFADGTDPEEEEIALSAGQLAEVDIAGCRYQGFPLVLTYRWDQDYFTSMMTHLPELGVSLELARMDQGGTALPFAPTRFSLSPP